MKKVKMCSSNKMKNCKEMQMAKDTQQLYYELLPDWFYYNRTDYSLIKYRIGYSLFGPPNICKDKQTSDIVNIFTVESTWENQPLHVVYDNNMCKAIKAIYEKIIKCSEGNCLYLGIIFNVILLHKVSRKSLKENDTIPICVVPVFKVRNLNSGVLYIDSDARVYNSWNDYIKKNTLPKCTMVLPKGGFYSCDPSFEVTKYSSTVWVESIDSPACSIVAEVLKGVDTAVNVASICAGAGLIASSFLTPVGPVITAAGIAVTGISGSWVVGRNVQKLVDLTEHKQSINVDNKNALSAWLGISSSILAFGSAGGSMLMTKAITNGSTITAAARLAYNSVLLSNLTVNGVGIVFQGYCLIDKYQTQKEIDILDMILFTSHILFFSNTLINIKLANKLITASEGTILERVKNTLRVNRFTEEFCKVRSTGNKNSPNGIVHKVQRVINEKDFFNVLPNICWNDGNMVINNKIFINPVIFTKHLLTVGYVAYNILQPDSPPLNDVASSIIFELKYCLMEKIRNFCKNKELPNVQLPDVSYINNILREIGYTTDPFQILSMIFKITISILRYTNHPKQFLPDMILYIWTYCKANLQSYDVILAHCPQEEVYIKIKIIVKNLYESIDEIGNELFVAFYSYMSHAKQTT